MAKSYGDTFPDTPENPRHMGGFGTGGDWLSSIRTPTRLERKWARDYMKRVAPDLLDVLGLA